MKSLLQTVIVAAGLLPAVVQAVPIDITVNSAGALLHTVGIADVDQYKATTGGTQNNNATANSAFLSAMIGNWNSAYNPDLPAAGALALEIGNIGGQTTPYNLLSGYQYAVIHFGAGNAGGGQVSPGGWWEAIYLGGDSLTLNLPQVPTTDNRGRTTLKNVGGFSSVRYFGTTHVPDGGATLALIGLGIAGLGVARRKLS